MCGEYFFLQTFDLPLIDGVGVYGDKGSLDSLLVLNCTKRHGEHLKLFCQMLVVRFVGILGHVRLLESGSDHAYVGACAGLFGQLLVNGEVLVEYAPVES